MWWIVSIASWLMGPVKQRFAINHVSIANFKRRFWLVYGQHFEQYVHATMLLIDHCHFVVVCKPLCYGSPIQLGLPNISPSKFHKYILRAFVSEACKCRLFLFTPTVCSWMSIAHDASIPWRIGLRQRQGFDAPCKNGSVFTCATGLSEKVRLCNEQKKEVMGTHS